MSRLDIPKIPAASNTPDERITSVSAVTLFLNSLPAENRGSASPLNAFEPSEVLGMSSRNKGFTIIELMISTVIFSLVLLMCLVGIVQVSRTYYKGVTRAKTQEATRRLMDEIKESIQLSGVKILPTTGPAGPEVSPPIQVMV